MMCLNVGISQSCKAPDPRVTADGLEEMVAVNHLGRFLLAGFIQPLLLLGSSGSSTASSSSTNGCANSSVLLAVPVMTGSS